MTLNRLLSTCPLILLSTIWGPLTANSGFSQDADNEIRLIVRSDDMGAAHSVNEACLQTVTEGIARSIEVIVPAPWFLEAAEMLQQHPEIDAGVHLDLTSEWSRVKWGPVLKTVPSLVDVNGHFFATTRQLDDRPPGTGFLESGWQMPDVERELRAQIETALRLLPKVTHLSAHMGTATSTPELQTLVQHLAREYNLPLLNVPRTGRFGGATATAAEKETQLIALLEGLKPGTWLLIEHPGLDTPELRAIGHPGYENVAADRAGVTQAFVSERVKDTIKRRGIKLISYADVIHAERTIGN